jgi:cytochrome c oxidase assembly protein subunit 15
VRRLGFIALAAVITQGILGGITVLWFLPDPISIAHASLAQLVFCLTTTIALVTSPGWRRAYAGDAGAAPDDRVLQKVAVATTVTIYLQIVIGATMRHTDAGLAIPDFPWAFGRLVPAFWNTGIAVHYAHRLGALAVTLLLLATAGHVFYHHRRRPELVRPSVLLLALLAVQITLGAYNIWSGLHFVVNSLHVVTGASILVTSLVLALRAHRTRFATGPETGERGRAYSPRLSGARA